MMFLRRFMVATQFVLKYNAYIQRLTKNQISEKKLKNFFTFACICGINMCNEEFGSRAGKQEKNINL